MNDPTAKSSPARSKMRSSKNCNLITHLTPTRLIIHRNSTAAPANNFSAHLLEVKFNNPANDSPNPTKFKLQPTAYKNDAVGVIYIFTVIKIKLLTWPKTYNNPTAAADRGPSTWAKRKYTPPLSTRHLSQTPTADSTDINAIPTIYQNSGSMNVVTL